MDARAGRLLLLAGLAAALAALATVGAVAWKRVDRLPPPREPSPVEARVAAWRAGGLRPSGTAEEHLRAGSAARRANLPAREAEALRHFAEALALDPASAAALGDWLGAFAEAAGDQPDGDELREAHKLATWALRSHPASPELLAGWARVLLLTPGERNAAEALAAAEKAVAQGGGAEALLAVAWARLPGDPKAAAEAAGRALEADLEDRRPLLLGARARWAAGDARGALEALERRLALDPGHPAAVSLQARVLVAVGRVDAARTVLRRWAAASRSAEPVLLQAMLAYQVDGDLAEARGLLRKARALPADDFLLARTLAHAAAVERAGGDDAAAQRLVDQALARVPASGPARFQEALLAFARGDAAAHRQAAGVVGQRAGALAARVLAARTQELAGQPDEAIAAWEGMAAARPRDLPLLLEAAASMIRLRAPGRAMPLLLKAAVLDPASPRARRAVGDYWEGPGVLLSAARRIEGLAVEELVAGPALAGAATCELLLGRTQAAEALTARAIAAAPQLARARVLRAQLWLDRGRAPEATREAAAALEAEPSNAVALEVMARALESLGRADAAEVRRRALAADPRLETARLGEARRLLREGQREKAREALRRLLADDPEEAQARGALLEAESRGK